MAGERNGRVTPIDSDSDKPKGKENGTKSTTVTPINNTKDKNKTQSYKSADSKLTDVESPAENMELQNMCAYRPKGDSLAEMPCCGSLFNKTGCKVIIFLAILILDAADLFSDWFLYYHVSAAEEGLVYGPTDAKLRFSLLAFSIIGSLTFTFEISNLWFEIFRNNPWVDIDLLSAITIWIEDVPQIIINVFLFACREEAISYFQLVKASLVIIGALLRFTIFLVRYCSKRARFDMQCAGVNPESRRHVIYRVFIMLGCVVTIAGATTVFLFVQVERHPNGSLNFKVPNSLIEGEYDNEKYFNNVSVYFSHELFDTGSPQNKHSVNLVRLLEINDIKQQQADQVIKIQYDKTTSPSKIIIDSTGSVKNSKECFQTIPGTDTLTSYSTTTCDTFISAANMKEFIFKFKFIKASVPELIFGDITYNVKVQDKSVSTGCKSVDFSITDTLDDHVTNSKIAGLHYYRSPSGNSQHIVLNSAGTGGTFYHSSNLEDISEVWKTGFTNCESSGSMAPHHDDTIPVQCT